MVAQEFVCAGLKHMDIVNEPGVFFCSKAEDPDFNGQSIWGWATIMKLFMSVSLCVCLSVCESLYVFACEPSSVYNF